VNFPLKDLDFKETLGLDAKYDLIANVIHSGKADEGSYRVQALHAASGEWFDIQDLIVTPILPQQVVISESYILLYKK
jgi:U4/U6.U5 tri-snRNP-associated protein 2